MRATLEIQYGTGWIDLPVEFSYSVDDDGRITLGPVTPVAGITDMTALLSDIDREYLLGLCRKDWAHHQSCREKSRRWTPPADIVAEERERVLNDPLSKARAGQ